MSKEIYTHDEAARIIDLFESILAEHDIKIPSPEDDEREADNDAVFYGSVYSDLLDEVEYILVEISKKIRDGNSVTPYVFSGTY